MTKYLLFLILSVLACLAGASGDRLLCCLKPEIDKNFSYTIWVKDSVITEHDNPANAFREKNGKPILGVFIPIKLVI